MHFCCELKLKYFVFKLFKRLTNIILYILYKNLFIKQTDTHKDTSNSDDLYTISYIFLVDNNDLIIHAYVSIGLAIFVIILISSGLCMTCFLRKRVSSKSIQAFNYSTSSLDSTSDKSVPTSVTVMPSYSSSLQIYDIIKPNPNWNLPQQNNSLLANV